MSDWLEEQLSQHLSGVRAPEELRVRLGLAPARRRVFPRTALALAAMVVMGIAGGMAAGRTAAAVDLRAARARNLEPLEFVAADPGAISVWLGHAAGEALPRTSDRLQFMEAGFTEARFVRTPVARRHPRSDGTGHEGNGTMLVSQAVRGGKAMRNAMLSGDAGCVFCHS